MPLNPQSNETHRPQNQIDAKINYIQVLEAIDAKVIDLSTIIQQRRDSITMAMEPVQIDFDEESQWIDEKEANLEELEQEFEDARKKYSVQNSYAVDGLSHNISQARQKISRYRIMLAQQQRLD